MAAIIMKGAYSLNSAPKTMQCLVVGQITSTRLRFNRFKSQRQLKSQKSRLYGRIVSKSQEPFQCLKGCPSTNPNRAGSRCHLLQSFPWMQTLGTTILIGQVYMHPTPRKQRTRDGNATRLTSKKTQKSSLQIHGFTTPGFTDHEVVLRRIGRLQLLEQRVAPLQPEGLVTHKVFQVRRSKIHERGYCQR